MKTKRRKTKGFQPQPPQPQTPKVWLSQSESTGNWLVMINQFCFDSAMLREDAIRVAEWVRQRLTQYPLPLNFSHTEGWEWSLAHSPSAPSVPAYAFRVQNGRKVRTVVWG